MTTTSQTVPTVVIIYRCHNAGVWIAGSPMQLIGPSSGLFPKIIRSTI